MFFISLNAVQTQIISFLQNISVETSTIEHSGEIGKEHYNTIKQYGAMGSEMLEKYGKYIKLYKKYGQQLMTMVMEYNAYGRYHIPVWEKTL